MRDSMIFYRSYYEVIKELPDEQKIKVYEAIFEYGLNDNEIILDGIERAIFNLAKPNINSANARYTASVENGKQGGRPKSKSLDKTQQKPSDNLDKTQREPNPKPRPKPRQNLNVDVDDDVDVNDNDDVVVGATKPTTTKSAVWDYYLNNINSTPVRTEIEQMEDYEKELPSDLIIYAMERAVDQKKRYIGYIKGIINDWLANGITTLAEAKEERKPKPKKDIGNRIQENKVIDYNKFYCNL